MGPARAVMVDNSTGIRRVLASKRSKYGPLNAPLLIAVQSNAEYPTADYDIEYALFGRSAYSPDQRVSGVHHLTDEGFWFHRDGWRNSHVPQVVTTADLYPWSVTKTRPKCWSTLEPGIALPSQPTWLAPMIVGMESVPGASSSISDHLGLGDDWPGMDRPDFDER